MDQFDDHYDWPELKPWDAEEPMQEEDKNDMRKVADMAEKDDPAGGKLYKMLCVASEIDTAQTICGFSRLHNCLVCCARLFDLVANFQAIKTTTWQGLNVERKTDAMKPLCAGILKFHERLERWASWGKA